MTNTFLHLEKLGINQIIIHRVRAFCPTTDMLSHLENKIVVSSDNSTEVCVHELHMRPLFNGENWTSCPVSGFAPSLTAGKSSASYTDNKNMLVRLLRPGIGILTETKNMQREADLVELAPSNSTHLEEINKLLEEFSKKFISSIDKPNVAETLNHQGDGENTPLLENTSFEIVEIQFNNEADLKKLDDKSCDTQELNDLRKAICYFLMRSYDMGVNGEPSLQRVVSELRPEALESLIKIGLDGRVYPTNLSQTTRGFITLGPRGAVLAFSKDMPHQALHVSALNMIEILRGRHFNLIVARAYVDEAIRTVGLLTGSHEYSNDPPLMQKALDQMMKANSLYGLVVSDPGAYLLDGSALTQMANVADKWFNIKSLRDETERKMEALHRFWQNFQDRRRIEVVTSLSSAFGKQKDAEQKSNAQPR